MMYEVPTLAHFQGLHPELFGLLTAAGWRPGEIPACASDEFWEEADRWFISNMAGIAFMIELSGVRIEVNAGTEQARMVQFGCTRTLGIMARNADFEADVHIIMGEQGCTHHGDVYPVGEGPGAVLFVRTNYYSAFIDQSLCGFFRAPDPFIILDWYLLGISSPLLEHRAVHQGHRIARYL